MGIVRNIRNFFYAATHANQLIASLHEKDAIIDMQTKETYELRSMLEEQANWLRDKEEMRKHMDETFRQATAVHTPLTVRTELPVGRIDYLGSNGQVGERMEFWNQASFVYQVFDDDHEGIPMSITVYSDPKTGKHIDTSWRLELYHLPQGFQITPYDPVANLTAAFTREDIANEIDLRLFSRVAIESTADYSEPGFEPDTVNGTTVDKYRVVTISHEGYHIAPMTRTLGSYEAAMDGLGSNPTVKILPYKELVQLAESRRWEKDSIHDFNRYSTEQLQQALDQLDHSMESPTPEPIPELEFELE